MVNSKLVYRNEITVFVIGYIEVLSLLVSIMVFENMVQIVQMSWLIRIIAIGLTARSSYNIN